MNPISRICIRFGNKLYTQIVGIPMGTNWAPLVADFFGRMVNQIYPPALKLNKANTSDTVAPFLDLYLYIYFYF